MTSALCGNYIGVQKCDFDCVRLTNPKKVVLTVDRHANTSAASVPLALWVATGDGRIGAGEIALIRRLVYARNHQSICLEFYPPFVLQMYLTRGGGKTIK